MMSRKKSSDNTLKKSLCCGILCVGLLVMVGIGLLIKHNTEKMDWGQIETVFPNRGLPRLNVSLNNVSLEEINTGSKDVKYEGNKMVVYDGRREVASFDDVQIKGRGNGTWVQEKKPYQIKFSRREDLFGMGKVRKWVLLANALDATNLRTDIAFYIERMLGLNNASDGRFVELYVDNEYQGLYYLTHAIEIGKKAVDLRDPLGIIIELDNIYGWMGEYYETNNKDKLVVKDVVTRDKTKEAMKEFLESFNEFEMAVKKNDYEKVTEMIDVESFAQYYLLSEFTVNPDAYWTSFYMYKDGSNDKIHAGPGWDFDLALANRVWGNWLGEEFFSSTNTMVRKREIMPKEMYEEMGLTTIDGRDWYGVSLNLSHVMFNLMEMPEFREEVGRVYKDKMKGRKNELIERIKIEAGEISKAVSVDEKKWGENGFWREIKTMGRWIGERYDYFDIVYGGENVLLDN